MCNAYINPKEQSFRFSFSSSSKVDWPYEITAVKRTRFVDVWRRLRVRDARILRSVPEVVLVNDAHWQLGRTEEAGLAYVRAEVEDVASSVYHLHVR